MSLFYKRTTILCFGMCLHTLCMFILFYTKRFLRFGTKALSTTIITGFTSFFFWIILSDNIVFSIFSGLFSGALYGQVYNYILKNIPNSFTMGEASVVCQGFVAFLYNAFFQIPNSFNSEELKYSANVQMQLILQVWSTLQYISLQYAYLKLYIRSPLQKSVIVVSSSKLVSFRITCTISIRLSR